MMKKKHVLSPRRGTWDLLDHYHQFFPLAPSYVISAILTIILELIRSTFSKFNVTLNYAHQNVQIHLNENIENVFFLYLFLVSNRLKILDDDTRLVVFKKNIMLSLFDILYNILCIAWWRSLWGHPEGNILQLPEL